jgi:uncharacterized RDD family membrane protein YckC
VSRPADTLRAAETPEGVELLLRPAGPVGRAIALAVDQALVWTALGLCFLVLGFLGALGVGLAFVLAFAAQWLYPVVMEVLCQGQTYGKRWTGLRVLMEDGRPVGWGPSLLRNLLRVVDALPGPYTVGLAALLATRDFRRLGDLAAGTLVVHAEGRARSTVLPEGEAVPPPVKLALEEQAALTSFAERSFRLTPSRAEELSDLLEPLTGARGPQGLARVLGMARFLRGGA